jgi:hypothetical protein
MFKKLHQCKCPPPPPPPPPPFFSIFLDLLSLIYFLYQWKAAKEELLEDEKEPEDAYEILERKRQREIEVCIWNIYQ